MVSIKLLKPMEIAHAPFKESCVWPVPNVFFKRWRRRRNVEIYLYNKLFGDDRMKLKKHEFRCQVQGWVGQL